MSIYLKKKVFLKTLKLIKDTNKNNDNMSFIWILKYSIGQLISFLKKLEYKRRTNFLKSYENEFEFLDKSAKSYLNINELQKHRNSKYE